MTRRMITDHILTQLGDDHDWTTGGALANWWVGTNETGSLQLNSIGNQVFKKIVTAWEIDLGGVTITPVRISQLARLTCPWHLRRALATHTVVLYGGREATVSKLYSSPAQWLDSLG